MNIITSPQSVAMDSFSSMPKNGRAWVKLERAENVHAVCQETWDNFFWNMYILIRTFIYNSVGGYRISAMREHLYNWEDDLSDQALLFPFKIYYLWTPNVKILTFMNIKYQVWHSISVNILCRALPTKTKSGL